ncbi:MAG: M3 family oligoendopeptidase, partial [Myxococcota bacterium]
LFSVLTIRARAMTHVTRGKVFAAFFDMWGEFADSIGATLATEVQSNIFQAKARNYDSALAAAVAKDNIPVEVYRTLVAETNAALPTLHRYFALRAKMLGVSDLGYFDIYPPLVQLESGARFDIERSKEITLDALKPFGNDYIEKLRFAFGQKWMHGQPRRGKRSGAYMNGSVYDVHPYILLNHNDDYSALTTFAHEWGHAVHTMLAVENQPYPTADYSIFTAEMASTINEILLQEHMISNAETREEKLFYLGQALEAIRGTLFRQAMFGEFELAIHEAAEKGEPLSGTRMSEMYLELLRKYHGHEQGVMNVDERFGAEWMYIPHFYYDFYVYQYATSISGAAWFAEKFLSGDDSARVAFLNVLKAGGSDYPYDILKGVGLDLAAPEPYRAAFRRMNDVMDRIEALLE